MNAPVYSLAEQIENTDILDRLILSLRSKRPKVSASLPFTAYSSGKMLQIWINTPACRFSLKGKCAACDYWDGVRSESAVRGVCDHIKRFGSRYETLLLNTCGSCMCEDELPFDDLMAVVNAISETSVRRIVFETHLAYATVEKMTAIKNVLAGRDVCLEYGQESTSPDALKLCLNKPSMLLKYDVVEELQKMGVHIIANVLLGIPFLSVRQRIEDAIASIRDLLERGIDEIMLFPVNIKPYTLVQFLYDNKFYKRVNAYELVKVLSVFNDDELERIGLAWIEPDREKIEAYDCMGLGPGYCEKCGRRLLEYLLEYRDSHTGRERKNAVAKMENETCSCIESLYDYTYPDIKSAYEFMRNSLKG